MPLMVRALMTVVLAGSAECHEKCRSQRQFTSNHTGKILWYLFVLRLQCPHLMVEDSR